MGQKNQLWWDLPALDSFLLLKEIYELPDDVYRRRVAELTDLLELGPAAEHAGPQALFR